MTLNLDTGTGAPAGSLININFYSTPTAAYTNVCSYDRQTILIKNYNFTNNVSHLTHNLDNDEKSFIVSQIRICAPSHSWKSQSLSCFAELVIECVDPMQCFAYVVIPLNSTQWTGRGEIDSMIDYFKTQIAPKVYTAKESVYSTENDSFLPSLPTRLHLNQLISANSQIVNAARYTADKTSNSAHAYQNTTMGQTSLFSGQPVNSSYSPWIICLDNAIPIDSQWISGANAIFNVSNPLLKTMYETAGSGGVSPPTMPLKNIMSGIAVVTPNSVADDNVYVDCSPDIEDGAEIDAGVARMKKANLFKLNSKNVNELCQSFLCGLSWVVFWFSVNNIFGNAKGSKIREHCCHVSNLLKSPWVDSDSQFSKISIGATFVTLLLFSALMVFVFAFRRASAYLFVISIHMLNVFFCLVYCSTLELFHNCTENAASN